MSTGARDVRFSWRGPAGRRVELCGDFPDWKYPVVMVEEAPGSYLVTLHLAPGVYRYRFRVDGREWLLDPHAPAVDAALGPPNGVITVGGVDAPWRITTARENVWRTPQGTVVLHAESPKGTPVPSTRGLRAEVQQRHGVQQLVAQGPVPPEGTLQLGEVTLPLPSPPQPLDAAPAWLHGATFYGIFLDRWHRGTTSPPLPHAQPRTTLSTPDTFYGGDLDGVAQSIPYLRDLGITAVVLTPLFRSHTPHRYDPVALDPLVDPVLGGEDALRRLVEQLHANNLRLILDAAVTHVHQDHPAFQDVLRHQQSSTFVPWFHIRRFPVVTGDGTTFAHYYRNPQLPWLNLAPGPAREHVLDVVERMLRTGVDGLRLDAMLDAPLDFWAALRARARAVNPDALLLGEIVGDRPLVLGEHRGVDTATDFTQHSLLLDWLCHRALDGRTFLETHAFHRHRKGPVPASFHLAFLDNHDTARFLSRAANHDVHRLALLWLLTSPHPAWLTYGAELGAFGGGPVTELDGAWTERIPMPPLVPGDSQTHALVKTLLRLRHAQPALLNAPVELHAAAGACLAVRRPHPDGTLVVAFNPTAKPWDLTTTLPAQRHVLLCVNAPRPDDNAPLSPWSGAVWRAQDPRPPS